MTDISFGSVYLSNPKGAIESNMLSFIIHLLSLETYFPLIDFRDVQYMYLQPIITQYFIDNKSEIWLLFLIAHSKR